MEPASRCGKKAALVSQQAVGHQNKYLWADPCNVLAVCNALIIVSLCLDPLFPQTTLPGELIARQYCSLSSVNMPLQMRSEDEVQGQNDLN